MGGLFRFGEGGARADGGGGGGGGMGDGEAVAHDFVSQYLKIGGMWFGCIVILKLSLKISWISGVRRSDAFRGDVEMRGFCGSGGRKALRSQRKSALLL